MQLSILASATFVGLVHAITITPSDDPDALVAAAVQDSRLVTLGSYYGPPGSGAGGIFTGGDPLGLPSGIILTTGKAAEGALGNTPSYPWLTQSSGNAAYLSQFCPGGRGVDFTSIDIAFSMSNPNLTGIRVNYMFATQEGLVFLSSSMPFFPRTNWDVIFDGPAPAGIRTVSRLFSTVMRTVLWALPPKMPYSRPQIHH